jgi:iron complex transport system substrate-binding protein
LKRAIALSLALLILILPGCGEAGRPVGSSDNVGVSFVDALGHNVEVQKADKVIALSGSFAEVWLLAGGKLTGTSADAFLDEFEFSLAENVCNVGSLQNPSVERIIALSPDLVILSKTIPSNVKLYDQLHAAGLVTAYFEVETLDEYLDMLKICTDITRRPDLYKANGKAVKARVDETIDKTGLSLSRPRVLLLRVNSTNINVRNSETTAGAMLKDLGCVNIADYESNLLENLSIEAIIRDDPDFIFAVPMGESEEKSLGTLKEQLTSNPAWAGLSAVKGGRYIILPKSLFHRKPNSRWGEAYETLYHILYEES